MTVLNDLDRFHLAMDVVERVRVADARGDYLKQQLADKLVEHREYIRAHGQDMPEVRNWQWPSRDGARD
jgi:xylulose-5-phosphate/fructose-6-phosphate phosphoketolase